MATPLPRCIGTDAGDQNVDSRTITIVGNTMTASGAMPLNWGIGNTIEYNISSVNHLAFVVSRESPTSFTIEDKDGGTPTSATAGQAMASHRVYLGMNDAGTQVANANITEPTAGDSDPDKDLVANDTQIPFPCYADGNDTTDAGQATWTVDATHFLDFFTPDKDTEVGVTQRHNGTLQAGTVAYRLEMTNASDSAIQPHIDFTRFTGLQVVVNEDTNNRSAFGTSFTPGDDLQISHNILKGVYTGTGTGEGIFNNQGINNSAWNNIIYDFTERGIRSHGASSTMTLYSNTIQGCDIGIEVTAGGKALLKNNIAQDCPTACYLATFSAVFEIGSTNNLADDSTADDAAENMANGIDNETLIFKNKAGDDFHLAQSDMVAMSAGVDLRTDPTLAVTDDIDGDVRPPVPDVGADEGGVLLEGLERHYPRGFQRGILRGVA